MSPDSFLHLTLWGLGILALLAGGFAMKFSEALCVGLVKFPRSRWAGRLLLAMAITWVAWVIAHADLGPFAKLQPYVPLLAILVYASIAYFLDELLAPRALGGLLMLVANPLLNGVRWSDSPLRFIVVLIAYLWVIAGGILMLHPWVFRRCCEKMAHSAAAIRRHAWVKLLTGALLLIAALLHTA